MGIDDLCYTMRWYGGEKCVVAQVVVGKTSNSGGSPIWRYNTNLVAEAYSGGWGAFEGLAPI